MAFLAGMACGLTLAVIIAALVWRYQIVPDEDFSRE